MQRAFITESNGDPITDRLTAREAVSFVLDLTVHGLVVEHHGDGLWSIPTDTLGPGSYHCTFTGYTLEVLP